MSPSGKNKEHIDVIVRYVVTSAKGCHHQGKNKEHIDVIVRFVVMSAIGCNHKRKKKNISM